MYCTFCQLLRHNSSGKTISAGGSEMWILLKDVPTAPDMTSETSHSKCAWSSSSENVRVNLRLKIYGCLFVWTIVTKEFAIWSVTIVKIRSYSTKTAIVTDKSDCWSVTMDVYHTAEETGETLTVWQENGRFTGISYHTAEESGETLTVWQIKNSGEVLHHRQGQRWMCCTIARYESTWLIAPSWSVVHRNSQIPVRRSCFGCHADLF